MSSRTLDGLNKRAHDWEGNMPQVSFDISMSLDGFVAGPYQTLEDPLGRGGMQLHEWAVATAAWRERHGLEGGESGPDSDLMAESLARQGAIVMGRRMFSGGSGPWEQDPNRDAWWGDDPPFHLPVFVVTHHAREPVEKEGGGRSPGRRCLIPTRPRRSGT